MSSSALKIGKILAPALLAAAFLVPAAHAEGIGGSWHGGGTVVFSDGHRERARCRAQYSQSGQHVSLEGTCATASGAVDQTARLRQTGPNSYAGTFYNSQFGIQGHIYVSVHGNSQSVSLRSSSGSASLSLHR
jgi:hypothetical protein